MRPLYNRYQVFRFLLLSLALSATSSQVSAGDDLTRPDFPRVEKVRMVYRGSGAWDVSVSVKHNDQGWDHYADRWQVLDNKNGEVLGERILAHPHDTEQPFTRSLSGLVIPEGVRVLRIRSGCTVHGFGGDEIIVTLPEEEPETGFTLLR